MAADSALIVISPRDSVETIIQKVRGAGAPSVELLVPDGTAALQALGGFARLRQSIERERIGLLVISSDERTLNAARLNQLDVVGVEGARVTLPAGADNGGPYATRPLSADDANAPTDAPISERDAEFLSALDEVSAQNRYADLSDEDAEMFAALDDLSDAIQSGGPARRGAGDDSLGEALDEWDATTNEGRAAENWDAAFAEGGAPRRRARAEDIALSDDDMRRQRGARRTEALRERAADRATPTLGGRRLRGARDERDERGLDLEEPEGAVDRRGALMRALPLVALLLLIALAAVWYFSSRATVTVAPPSASADARTFSGEPIPLTSSATGPDSAAVQAQPVQADAEFTAQGQVVSETLSPASTAKGIVTLINTIPQPIQLPAGAELVGSNPQGQEVRFTLDAPATVPPAVTSTSLTGTSTQFGTIDVGVTARSPGAASNIGENSLKQLIIPGQQPLVSDSSNFLIRHAPIGGGADQPQRIVTTADRDRVLGDALTGLYNAGVQALRAKIDEAKMGIDPISLFPDPQALGRSENYDPVIVNPPIGQPVDPNNPTFSVTVKAHFSALATPLDRPLARQLETVGPQHFNQLTPPPCNPGEQPNMTITNPHWDGTALKIDATINCVAGRVLPASTLGLVRDAVRGRTRADAEAQLQALQAQGLIGGYTLPANRDSFPSLELLLDIEPAGGAPTPTEAAPTQAAPPAAPTTGAP